MSNTELLGVGSRIIHPAFGDGVIIRLLPIAYEVCYRLHGIKSIGKQYDKWEVVEAIPTEEEVDFSSFEKSILKILKSHHLINDDIPLGNKWEGGLLILQPEDRNLKPKEIPIETFFHKIVMVRDRLRLIEQRINSSKLTDEEKVNLQQYITRIYGSLTSFNVLFDRKEDAFSGESKGI